MLSVIGVLMGIFAFGTYMVPLKKWPQYSSWSYLVSMSVGAVLCALVIAFLTDSVQLAPIGLVCGAIWVIGGALCFWAVQAEKDLAGTGLRSMCVSILLSFVTGVTIFKEPTLFYFSIPAIVCMLGGIYIQTPKGQPIFKNWRSLCSGAVFGSYLIPFKLFGTPNGVTDMQFLLPFAVGICITSIILVTIMSIVRGKSFGFEKAPTFVAVLTGVLWMIGTLGIFWGIAEDGMFGYAIGYPLLQLNLVVNQMWGVFVYGEYATRKERVTLVISTLVILLGAVLLTISKG